MIISLIFAATGDASNLDVPAFYSDGSRSLLQASIVKDEQPVAKASTPSPSFIDPNTGLKYYLKSLIPGNVLLSESQEKIIENTLLPCAVINGCVLFCSEALPGERRVLLGCQDKEGYKAFNNHEDLLFIEIAPGKDSVALLTYGGMLKGFALREKSLVRIYSRPVTQGTSLLCHRGDIACFRLPEVEQLEILHISTGAYFLCAGVVRYGQRLANAVIEDGKIILKREKKDGTQKDREELILTIPSVLSGISRIPGIKRVNQLCGQPMVDTLVNQAVEIATSNPDLPVQEFSGFTPFMQYLVATVGEEANPRSLVSEVLVKAFGQLFARRSLFNPMAGATQEAQEGEHLEQAVTTYLHIILGADIDPQAKTQIYRLFHEHLPAKDFMRLLNTKVELGSGFGDSSGTPLELAEKAGLEEVLEHMKGVLALTKN